MNKMKKGFTLAEVLITLTLLGIVAAITIPTTLNNTSRKHDVLRVRKAITNFEKTVEQMRITNGLKAVGDSSTIADKTTLYGYAMDNQCDDLRKEFKIKTYLNTIKGYEGASLCQFQSSDGIWWNFENVTTPIISPLKDGYQYLTDDYAKASNKENKSFYLTVKQGDKSQGFAFFVNNYEHESGIRKLNIGKTLVFANIMQEDNIVKLSVADVKSYEHCDENKTTNCVENSDQADERLWFKDSEGTPIFIEYDEKGNVTYCNSEIAAKHETCEIIMNTSNCSETYESFYMCCPDDKEALYDGYCS